MVIDSITRCKNSKGLLDMTPFSRRGTSDPGQLWRTRAAPVQRRYNSEKCTLSVAR